MAFVGPNGSGKTTLIKLLLRFYEIDSGTILINELPIQNYSRENLYEKFSALFQDFVRYDLTLSENIRIGRVDNIGDEDRIYWALGEVGLKELLNRLPKGIDTTLGRKFDNGRESYRLANGKELQQRGRSFENPNFWFLMSRQPR